MRLLIYNTFGCRRTTRPEFLELSRIYPVWKYEDKNIIEQTQFKAHFALLLRLNRDKNVSWLEYYIKIIIASKLATCSCIYLRISVKSDKI